MKVIYSNFTLHTCTRGEAIFYNARVAVLGEVISPVEISSTHVLLLLLLLARSFIQDAEFHSYCRPLLNPYLSEFCTNLTGIKQVHVPFTNINFMLWNIDHCIFVSITRHRSARLRHFQRFSSNLQNGWIRESLVLSTNLLWQLTG